MTPLQLSILLHYHSLGGDFRSGDFSAPAVRDAIDGFLKEGMLDSDLSRGSRTYMLSDRARVYLDHILAQPLPVKQWVMPPHSRPPRVCSAGCFREQNHTGPCCTED